MTLGKIKKWWEKYEIFWILLGVVATVVGVAWGATAYIKSTAENAVLHEQFLATLSKRVRPSCIVNSKGTVEAELGAEEYIDGFKIVTVTNIRGFEVTITPKRHLAYPPQVTALNSDVISVKSERGTKHDWRIVMSPQKTENFYMGYEDMNTNVVYRFLVEILH